MNWPFSDLSGSKIRPAVVIAGIDRDDYILCQETSQNYHRASLPVDEPEFERGGLRKKSHALYTHLFTADERVIIREVGRLNGGTTQEILVRLKGLLDAGSRVSASGPIPNPAPPKGLRFPAAFTNWGRKLAIWSIQADIIVQKRSVWRIAKRSIG